jgi:hypothetical protein
MCSPLSLMLERHTGQMIVPIWNRQHNTGHSRRNAVASLNQPRQSRNEKYCRKWKRFGRSLLWKRVTERTAKRCFDLVLIRICLAFLCQGKPHSRHLQENGSVLFILGGACHFQALCGEATVLVRPGFHLRYSSSMEPLIGSVIDKNRNTRVRQYLCGNATEHYRCNPAPPV